MQESALAFLDAVVQTYVKGAAGKNDAGRAINWRKRRRQNCRRSKRERSGGSRRRRIREYVAAHPDGEREKDVEAAEKIAEQETFRRSVAAHMSGQQGTSSAYMMRPDTPADSPISWLSLVTCVARAGTRLMNWRI
jgi:hypothetical protein